MWICVVFGLKECNFARKKNVSSFFYCKDLKSQHHQPARSAKKKLWRRGFGIFVCVSVYVCASVGFTNNTHTATLNQLYWLEEESRRDRERVCDFWETLLVCVSGKGVACERIIYWCVCVCVCMIMILAFWTNRSLRWILCSMIVLRSFRFYANELSLLNLFWSGSFGQILVNSYF